MSSTKKILINSHKKLNIPKLKKFQVEKNNIEKINPYKSYDLAIEFYNKSINNDKNNISLIIKRAICYLAKNLYNNALKDALTIKNLKDFNKTYYIASLCRLEM